MDRVINDSQRCQYCGNHKDTTTHKSEYRECYDYDVNKKLEHLHRIEITLNRLEEELDLFLCKKS